LTTPPKFTQQFQAGHLGHVHIYNQAMRSTVAQFGQEVGARSIHPRVHATRAQQIGESLSNRCVIVNDCDVPDL
jgi:hypothetical protein